MRYLMLVVALAATACAELHVTDLSDQSMELSYYAPASGWTNATAGFDIELRSRCPNGYEKLSESAKDIDGRSTYFWHARCL